MIDKNEVAAAVREFIAGTDLFLVSVTVTPDDVVTVTVDSPNGVDIDRCAELSRRITERFDRDVEDYELEVGSAGLTAPFTVPEQYRMNIGNPVEVLTRDGRKLHATLTDVNDDCTAITVTVATKVKEPGQKRPHVEEVPRDIPVADIKRIVREIKF